MFKRNTIFAICLAALPASGHAATVTLTEGADWEEFRFDENREGGAWLEPNDNLGILSFSVSLPSSAYLQVTDAHRSGDKFEVFSGGVSLGFTSDPSVVGNAIGNDYTSAFSDERWSSGEWLLGPGNYSISGFIRVQPETFGRGAVRLVSIPATTTVPVPSTLPLLLSASVLLGATAGRKKRAAERPA